MTGVRRGTLRVLILIVSLLVWEALVRIFPVPQFILPAPSRILMALYRGAQSGVYLHNFWFTLSETLLGFVVGSLLAIGLGTLIALNRRLEYYLYPYIVMFQSMPKVAIAPLIIVWFGIGLTSKVISAVMVAFFPLLVNTVVGLRSADEDRVNLMRSLAASERQIFWMLRLPSALPFIMAGLEVAMILSLIGAIVAEFIGAEAGLGVLIQSMNFNMDVAGEFSVLFVLAVMGLVLNVVVTSVRRRVLFWDVSQKDPQDTLSVKRGNANI